MSEMAFQRRASDQIRIQIALLSELARRGVENVTIWIPFLNPSTASLRQFVTEVADKLEPVARSCSDKVKVCISGYTYTVCSSPGIGNVIFVRVC
jgi:hypothetical protein